MDGGRDRRSKFRLIDLVLIDGRGMAHLDRRECPDCECHGAAKLFGSLVKTNASRGGARPRDSVVRH
jgi:hypothetical protein